MKAEVENRRRRAASNRRKYPDAAPRTHERASVISGLGPAAPRPRRSRTISPLTLRILALNVLALGILVGGLLYLGEYQRSLVDAKLEALGTQGRIFAGALGETAVTVGAGGSHQLDKRTARLVMRRIVVATSTRARLYDAAGALIVDSRALLVPGGFVQEEELPPLAPRNLLGDAIIDAYDWVVNWLPSQEGLPPYQETANPRASDYPEVMTALAGDPAGAVRLGERRSMILSFAVPVQRLKKVAGALLLTSDSAEIETDLRTVRLDILKIFGIVLLVTVLMSFYLASAIARPIRKLALAADQVRGGRARQVAIPDFTRRKDEIGDLSGSLRQMTEDLWRRMEAVESFAADVAHEIKNPLTSLRSAVETAAKVTDPESQRELMAIILDDVQRLDRLISDISHASRLDAELSRAPSEPVDIGRMLSALAEVHTATSGATANEVEVALHGEPGSLVVNVIEDRLVQVIQNLFANAISFSPEGGVIRLAAWADGDFAVITISDEGPGIPESALGAIFTRFYSERPVGEKFGTHSGLGLAISKQIVEAHGGTIHAENLQGPDGGVKGARFVIRLPLEPSPSKFSRSAAKSKPPTGTADRRKR
jgi:two-component system sensor histidine kinase ChvG